jgi:hypothetical protein
MGLRGFGIAPAQERTVRLPLSTVRGTNQSSQRGPCAAGSWGWRGFPFPMASRGDGGPIARLRLRYAGSAQLRGPDVAPLTARLRFLPVWVAAHRDTVADSQASVRRGTPISPGGVRGPGAAPGLRAGWFWPPGCRRSGHHWPEIARCHRRRPAVRAASDTVDGMSSKHVAIVSAGRGRSSPVYM